VLRGDLADELARRIAAAAEAAFEIEISLDEAAIRPAPPERQADYQSNVAMPLGKRLSLPSRDVAARIVERFDPGDMLEPPQAAGPGFINLTLRRDWLERHAWDLVDDERLGAAAAETPRKVVVDYSSPNAAKEMHAGHLRSTILGDAIVRLLRFAGHQVIPQNHLGDWGTPFGMLVEQLIEEGGRGPASAPSPTSTPSTRRPGPASSPILSSPSGPAAGWWPCRPATRRRWRSGESWSGNRCASWRTCTASSVYCCAPRTSGRRAPTTRCCPRLSGSWSEPA
jgi:hypothetical protein